MRLIAMHFGMMVKVQLEFPYVARVEGLLNDYFEVDGEWGFDGITLNPRSEVDKEVLIRAIPAQREALLWTVAGVEAWPWVPTGLMSGMQYLAHTEQDFRDMRLQYREFVREIVDGVGLGK